MTSLTARSVFFAAFNAVEHLRAVVNNNANNNNRHRGGSGV